MTDRMQVAGKAVAYLMLAVVLGAAALTANASYSKAGAAGISSVNFGSKGKAG